MIFGEITISIPFSYVVTVIASVVTGIVSLALAVAYMYKQGEAKNKEVIELTKSFLQATNDYKIALEKTTQVIERLPEQIILHMKAKNL